MRQIAVIGGGVAGLTVAWRRSRLGERVDVFEASARLGGKIHTERSAGFLIEHGAEGFVAGSAAVANLARSLGIDSQSRDQLVRDSCHFDGSRLSRLEPGEAGRLLGFHVGVPALGKGIQSFQRGMGELVEALQGTLSPTCRWVPSCPIRTLERGPAGRGWRVVPVQGEPLLADAVVIATSSADAAQLLGEAFGQRATALRDSGAVSSVTVSLAYPRTGVLHPLDATGFVVAEGAQDEGFRACTFASSKLPQRAPSGHVLLRLFFRPAPKDLAEWSDAEWVARAERCARRALRLEASAERAWVSRWAGALPVFDAAHRQRVADLEAELAGTGVVLAGAAFHGAGIDGAVRSAEAAALALSNG